MVVQGTLIANCLLDQAHLSLTATVVAQGARQSALAVAVQHLLALRPVTFKQQARAALPSSQPGEKESSTSQPATGGRTCS